MQGQILARTLLMSCLFGAAVAPAFANHRTGDFSQPELIVTGDFNRDGITDLAVNVSGFDNIAILIGNGQGDFTLERHIETDTLPRGLASGDLNSDGHVDLASITEWGYNIRLHLGDGLGGFVPLKELNGDGEPTRVALRDMNNDGNLDLIACGPAEGVILIYFGDGNGGFSNSALELEDLMNDYSFAIGDLNHDGNLDLAVNTIRFATTTDDHVSIYLSDGAGGFVPGAELPTNPRPAAIALGDLNDDGNIDIIVGGAGPDNDTGLFLTTYLGNSSGNFTQKQLNTLGPGVIEGEMALGDFNEDGNVDVAFPITFSQSETRSTTVLIFLGDGSGNLSSGEPLTVGQEPHTAITTDFNGDGHADLAVTNRRDGTVSILLGNGQGGFSSHAVIPIAVLPEP
jgi:hypothetical protein